MTVAPQADQEVVVGVVQGIVQKAADKWQVEVNVGQQNPRRLWTKDAGLVQQMSMMIGQTLSFMCGVSNWTNNQNQPVRSLWINGYGQPGAMQDPTVPTIPQPQYPQPPVQQPGAWAQNTPAPQQQWQPPAALQQWEPAQQQPVQAVPQQPMAAQIMPQEREERILREAAAGVAVQLLRHLHVEEQNFANLIRLSERLVHYYKNGVPSGWTGENPGGAGISGDPGPDGQPHSDDDIPF